jgi:serine/threonine protein kinase
MWRRGWVSIRSRLANGGGASWKAVPVDLDVHLVMDTYATHKTPLIRDWLVKRPRWPVHHTPTGATRPREVTGTDPYIAPEECVRGEVTPAADVFGLAVLVYELLTGALPFGQGTRADPFPQTSRAPSPSRTHRPAAPKRLDDLLLSCLARNPRDRPPLSALLLGLHDFIRAGRRMWPAGFTPAPASVEAVSPMRADERNAA